MIYPSIYSFNAPYRGPKESKEINKLFTSIMFDLLIAYDELESYALKVPDNLRFCILSEVHPAMNITTSGLIGEENYSYRGVMKISQDINKVKMKIDQILENL